MHRTASVEAEQSKNVAVNGFDGAIGVDELHTLVT
jgi:hypothetical protein